MLHGATLSYIYIYTDTEKPVIPGHSWTREDDTWARDSGDRQRRETERGPGGGRGSVEFVHPDLKQELSKQGEDPNNPWVWLTSYSRIPVSYSKKQLVAELIIFSFSWKLFKSSVQQPRSIVHLARREERESQGSQECQVSKVI